MQDWEYNDSKEEDKGPTNIKQKHQLKGLGCVSNLKKSISLVLCDGVTPEYMIMSA